MQKAQGPGVCKLPKPPASRALCQAKRAPRAAFPSIDEEPGAQRRKVNLTKVTQLESDRAGIQIPVLNPYVIQARRQLC